MAMVAHLGLAQELDNQMLFRCVQMVRRMKRRPRKVGLFCSLSPASLADADFFAQFSEYLESEPELADFLVFELPLAALEDAGGAAAGSGTASTDGREGASDSDRAGSAEGGSGSGAGASG